MLVEPKHNIIHILFVLRFRPFFFNIIFFSLIKYKKIKLFILSKNCSLHSLSFISQNIIVLNHFHSQKNFTHFFIHSIVLTPLLHHLFIK